jgi:hypothetical protein
LVVVVCFFVDVVLLYGVEHSSFFLVACRMDMICSRVLGGWFRSNRSFANCDFL